MTSERRDMPELASGIGGKQSSRGCGYPLVTRLFAAEREEGNPDTGG
jgi:hypothetical protein